MNKQILLIALLFCTAFVSALPLQLLPNGTLVDSPTINGTPVDIVIYGGSVYFVEKIFPNITQDIIYENHTYIENITYVDNIYENITYINSTCFNCSYNYVSNYSINGTSIQNFTYNKSEIDSKFVGYMLTSDANSKFPLKSEINLTISETPKTSTTTLWGAVIILFLFCIIIVVMLIRGPE